MKKALFGLIIAVFSLAGLSLYQFRENLNLRRELRLSYSIEADHYQRLLTQTSRIDWENIDLEQEEAQQLVSDYRYQLNQYRFDAIDFQTEWWEVSLEIRTVTDLLRRLQDQGELTPEEYDELETLSHGLGRLFNNVQFTSRFDWYNALREENPEVSEFIADTLEDL